MDSGGLRPPSELYLVIALYLVAKFNNLPGKMQNLGAKFFVDLNQKLPLTIRSKFNSELISKISCLNFGN